MDKKGEGVLYRVDMVGPRCNQERAKPRVVYQNRGFAKYRKTGTIRLHSNSSFVRIQLFIGQKLVAVDLHAEPRSRVPG